MHAAVGIVAQAIFSPQCSAAAFSTA